MIRMDDRRQGPAGTPARKSLSPSSSDGIGSMPRWSVYTLVRAEYTGRGAGRPRSAALLRLDRSRRSPPSSLHAAQHLEPRRGLRPAEVVETEPAGEHQRQRCGRRGGPRTSASPSGRRDRPTVSPATRRAHGARQVVVPATVDVAHPHDERLGRDLRARTAPPRASRARRPTAARGRRSRRRGNPSRRRRRSRSRRAAGRRRSPGRRARGAAVRARCRGTPVPGRIRSRPRACMRRSSGSRRHGAARRSGEPRRDHRRRAPRDRRPARRGGRARAPGTPGRGRRRRR